MEKHVKVRFPSVASLLAKKVCATKEEATSLRRLAKKGYTRHSHLHVSHDVTEYLSELSKAGGWYGVESLYDHTKGVDGGPLSHIYYLNAGDTYATTILFSSRTNNAWIGTWGDLAERGRP